MPQKSWVLIYNPQTQPENHGEFDATSIFLSTNLSLHNQKKLAQSISSFITWPFPTQPCHLLAVLHFKSHQKWYVASMSGRWCWNGPKFPTNRLVEFWQIFLNVKKNRRKTLSWLLIVMCYLDVTLHKSYFNLIPQSIQCFQCCHLLCRFM